MDGAATAKKAMSAWQRPVELKDTPFHPPPPGGWRAVGMAITAETEAYDARLSKLNQQKNTAIENAMKRMVERVTREEEEAARRASDPVAAAAEDKAAAQEKAARYELKWPFAVGILTKTRHLQVLDSFDDDMTDEEFHDYTMK